MNNQPHVRLVDAHSERVSGCDHLKVPVDEPLLCILLKLGRQTAVVVSGANALLLQELGHLVSPAPRGAVDYRASFPS